MSETLQTRSEHSRSLEDAERFRALDTLKELGALIPLDHIDTVHGRAKHPTEEDDWRVDSSFTNGANDSGNNNIHARPALYTADSEHAQLFADMRAHQLNAVNRRRHFTEKVRAYSDSERQAWLSRLTESGRQLAMSDLSRPQIIIREAERLQRLSPDEDAEIGNSFDVKAELHDIASTDIDAVIVNARFSISDLSETDRKRYHQALQGLAIKVSEGSPLAFKHRNENRTIGAGINEKMRQNDTFYLTDEEIDAIAAEKGTNKDATWQLATAFNASQFMARDLGILTEQLLNTQTDIAPLLVNQEGTTVPVSVNYEYVQRYLRMAHIVGVTTTYDSLTIGKKFDGVSLFDLEKVDASAAIDKKRGETQDLFGSLTEQFEELNPNNQSALLSLLAEPYASPQKLIATARSTEGYDAVYAASTGTWERFTLAEHSETVLRNFNENFADELPVEILGPLRLAILVHDLGKPEAAAHRELHKQQEYNDRAARVFLEKIGASQRLTNVILALIGEGERLAALVQVRKSGTSGEEQLREFAKGAITDLYATQPIDERAIDGFVEMCKILQICDGGAYTSMAVTRTETNGIHRNAPSFNRTFARAAGLGKRTLRLRRDGEEPAD